MYAIYQHSMNNFVLELLYFIFHIYPISPITKHTPNATSYPKIQSPLHIIYGVKTHQFQNEICSAFIFDNLVYST